MYQSTFFNAIFFYIKFVTWALPMREKEDTHARALSVPANIESLPDVNQAQKVLSPEFCLPTVNFCRKKHSEGAEEGMPTADTRAKADKDKTVACYFSYPFIHKSRGLKF